MSRLALLSLALMPAMATSALAQDPAYTLVIKDHQFQPTEIEVPAGQKIALTVKNNDSTPEQITVYIGPLKPGKYEFFGDFNPKTARGHIIAK
jgi:Cupredoxin-like domain